MRPNTPIPTARSVHSVRSIRRASSKHFIRNREKDGIVIPLDHRSTGFASILHSASVQEDLRRHCRACFSHRHSFNNMSFRQCFRSVIRSTRTISQTGSSVTRPTLSVRPIQRYLSSSAPRLASQEDEFASAFEQSPLFNVIKSHPTAMEAIKEIGDIMQKKGQFASV
jgi:hypothetical protein